MVRDTGEASERFLRSVAFGEVDMKDARAQGIRSTDRAKPDPPRCPCLDAAKGLERMSSIKSSSSVGWTSDLLGSAHQALKHLSLLRDQLTARKHKLRVQASGDLVSAFTESDLVRLTVTRVS